MHSQVRVGKCTWNFSNKSETHFVNGQIGTLMLLWVELPDKTKPPSSTIRPVTDSLLRNAYHNRRHRLDTRVRFCFWFRLAG